MPRHDDSACLRFAWKGRAKSALRAGAANAEMLSRHLRAFASPAVRNTRSGLRFRYHHGEHSRDSAPCAFHGWARARAPRTRDVRCGGFL